jgi:hypothetical protein
MTYSPLSTGAIDPGGDMMYQQWLANPGTPKPGMGGPQDSWAPVGPGESAPYQGNAPLQTSPNTTPSGQNTWQPPTQNWRNGMPWMNPTPSQYSLDQPYGGASGFNPGPVMQAPQTPNIPDWRSYMGMSPFERAAMRTQTEMSGTPWEQQTQNMRDYWNINGTGPWNAPQQMSQQAMASMNPMDQIGFNQVLDTYGMSPQQYMQAHQRRQAPSRAAQVQMTARG